jgi:hypothetical protein
VITFESYFNSEDNHSTVNRPLAPVVYCGRQYGPKGSFFDLFDLTTDIDGHPEGSTVGQKTLEDHGFYVPIISSSMKRGDPLVDDRVTEGRITKNNPFGYNRVKAKPHKLLPRNTFKHNLSSKPKKYAPLKPRSWKISSSGSLKKFYEASDPDTLYELGDKETITFIIVSDIGFIYTTNTNVDGQYENINHTCLRDSIDGQIVLAGPNKFKTKIRHYIKNAGAVLGQWHYVYFYLLPGATFADLKKSIGKYSPANTNRYITEGRINENIFTTWAPRKLFAEEAKGLWEKMASMLDIDPSTLSYNFAEVGDLPYDHIYDNVVKSDPNRKQEMELLRQIHLNPAIKKGVLGVTRDKGSDIASKAGINTKAKFNNLKIIGDSL